MALDRRTTGFGCLSARDRSRTPAASSSYVKLPVRVSDRELAFARTDRQNGTTSIVYGNPFYDHLAALPLARPGEFARSYAGLRSRTSSAFDASSLSTKQLAYCRKTAVVDENGISVCLNGADQQWGKDPPKEVVG